MNRTELAKLDYGELIDKVIVLEERQRRATEPATSATWSIQTRWVKAPEASGIVVPSITIAQMFVASLVEAYERTSPLEPRIDGWDGPFVKSVTVDYMQNNASRPRAATWEEEPL